ncbi:hypothetical protein SAZ10_19775 [Mesorhizobium sp. BAC0120]|uniref:hypothetical protein n=1 Tax=Mesorhizobium sp. BAC0120 TaxID=3090670 RepID=UPI00298CAD7F|nr:hypothetical protein [Mesorhizobium sp. BAC0120]MDW6023989.1 hypothetical protein [Mesorhizobium sp. BAC0120]
MAVATSQIGSRFEIGKVFGTTFAVIGRNIGLWIGLAVIFSGIPTLILQFLIWNRLNGIAATDPNTLQADPGMIGSTVLFGVIGGLISIVLAALLQSALIRATIEDLSDRSPSIGDCISTALSVLLPAIGIGLLAGIGVVIGFALLIVPGIILFLRWSLAVPVLVQERQGVLGSMGRSSALTKGSRWALFGLFLILVIAAIIIQWVFGMIVPVLGSVLGLVVAALVQSILSMVFSTASAVSYVELRQVKEGTSVQELAKIFS